MSLAAPSIRPALLMAGAGFCLLAVGDAVVKTIAGAWPATAVAALRYTFGTIGLAAIVLWRQGRAGFVMPLPWAQVGRGFAVATATVTFFAGVHLMPLADTTSIVFTSPMWTALISAVFLRERIQGATWAAIMLAFAGVLVVLRPNLANLGAAALLPLVAALGMAVLMVLNRRVAGLAPVFTMQFLVAALGTPFLIAAAFAADRAGVPGYRVGWPDPSVVLRCLAVAFTATAGHWCIFRATEIASAARIAPMTYSQIVIALGAGWLVFGDRPDLVALAGTTLIIAGGLVLWWNDRVGVGPATPE